MPTSNARGAADEAQFEVRIEGVRVRFAQKFAGRMQQTAAALPRMTEDESAAIDAVATAYRWLHEVGGIASTIGFAATGQSARSCEAILAGPCRDQRGLSAAEAVTLTEHLEALRLTAQTELRTT